MSILWTLTISVKEDLLCSGNYYSYLLFFFFSLVYPDLFPLKSNIWRKHENEWWNVLINLKIAQRIFHRHQQVYVSYYICKSLKANLQVVKKHWSHLFMAFWCQSLWLWKQLKAPWELRLCLASPAESSWVVCGVTAPSSLFSSFCLPTPEQRLPTGTGAHISRFQHPSSNQSSSTAAPDAGLLH